MSRRPKVIKKLCTEPPGTIKAPDNGVSDEYFEGLEEIVFDMEDPTASSPEKCIETSSSKPLPTSDSLTEIHKLMSDSFMFMHEKLQGLEEMTEHLQKSIDVQDKKRLMDNMSLKTRLNTIEKSLSTIQGQMSVSGSAAAKKRSAVPVRTDTKASTSKPAIAASSSNRPEEPSLFPLKTSEAMERLAEEAALNSGLRKSLKEMFLVGRANPEVTMRNWISDKVLAEYSTSVNTAKKCISESSFICLIRDAWLSEIFTIDQFEANFERILEDIEQKRPAKKVRLGDM